MLTQLDRKLYRLLSPRLKEIYIKAYQPLPQYAYHDPEQVDAYLDWLFEGDPAGIVVACSGDAGPSVFGFAAVHGNWRSRDGRIVGELHELVVDPQAQGQGVATALLRWAIRYACQLGRPVIGLWVGEHNHRAAALYQRFGFQRIGQWGRWVRMELPIARTQGSASLTNYQSP